MTFERVELSLDVVLFRGGALKVLPTLDDLTAAEAAEVTPC